MRDNMFLSSQKEKIYSVTQLNREARLALEGGFSSIWVEAEISNLKKHTSGHIYLSLKDEQSQISAVFFSRYNMAVKFDLKDGLKVIAMGRVSLYEPRGQYQFFIEKLQPKGLGELQMAFLQLKEKLEKEGLFSQDRKRAIPSFPKTIGVVTSPTGAAIRDILNILGRRFKSASVLICPVKVQGEGAAKEIAQAIQTMNEYGKADVLIVGRGGGSLEDLWAFNEEPVARAVAASKIPVISAVGHEIDWTICDFVADLRAPTPSAAAELVVQNSGDIERRLWDTATRMKNAVQSLIMEKRSEVDNLASSYAFRQPETLIRQYSQKVDELYRQLGNYLRSFVGTKKQVMQNLAGRLNALSPLGILERGYSISFNSQNELLKDARSLKKGDLIKTRLFNGIAHSEVIKIEEE